VEAELMVAAKHVEALQQVPHSPNHNILEETLITLRIALIFLSSLSQHKMVTLRSE
jgi:hypothetical protein